MNKELVPLRNEDRTDPKWAHPIVAEGWGIGGMAELVDTIMVPGMSFEKVKQARDRLEAMTLEMLNAAAPKGDDSTGEWSEYWAPGLKEEENAPQVRIKVRSPKNRGVKPLPAVFYIFGGGLCVGSPELFQADIKTDCEQLGAVVFAPAYRLAPEHKYPAAVNDLHAAYKWMVENAEKLGIDTDQILIHGESSGGHLSAALTHRLKRYNYINGIMPRAQMLIIPVMDDRQMMPSSDIIQENGWDSKAAHLSWLAWLGVENIASAKIGPEAVPGHAQGDDFKGLPPAFIHCMESDSDRDDAIRYASGLLAAGVFCELHQWGGTNHTSFATFPSVLQQRYATLLITEMQGALKYDLRRLWLK